MHDGKSFQVFGFSIDELISTIGGVRIHFFLLYHIPRSTFGATLITPIICVLVTLSCHDIPTPFLPDHVTFQMWKNSKCGKNPNVEKFQKGKVPNEETSK